VTVWVSPWTRLSTSWLRVSVGPDGAEAPAGRTAGASPATDRPAARTAARRRRERRARTGIGAPFEGSGPDRAPGSIQGREDRSLPFFAEAPNPSPAAR